MTPSDDRRSKSRYPKMEVVPVKGRAARMTMACDWEGCSNIAHAPWRFCEPHRTSGWCYCGDGGRADVCTTCRYPIHGTEWARAEHKRLCAEVRAR